MSAAVAAILGGMPEPGDLRMRQEAGRCVITAGSVVLFEYDAGDILMRNMALVALRRLGFPGQVVAQLLGLSASYVPTLFAAAKREGSAALAGQQRRGAPGTVSEQQWELARAWRAAGASDAEIGRRLGVAHATISRALGPRGTGLRREGRAAVHRPGTRDCPGGRCRTSGAGDRGGRDRVAVCGGDAAHASSRGRTRARCWAALAGRGGTRRC